MTFRDEEVECANGHMIEAGEAYYKVNGSTYCRECFMDVITHELRDRYEILDADGYEAYSVAGRIVDDDELAEALFDAFGDEYYEDTVHDGMYYAERSY